MKYKPVQLELDLMRPLEEDRNFKNGGRSFYFFDFDDNVACLNTPIVLFHKESGKEVFLGSSEYAKNSKIIGKTGPYADYRIDYDDSVGSFRFFRDIELSFWDKILMRKQPFLNDIKDALLRPDIFWKGPSWNFFYHAIYNNRPISLITARGHSIETMKDGVELLLKSIGLDRTPNYLSIYPVSNPEIKRDLSKNDPAMKIPALKKVAIRESFNEAIKTYGNNPYHRFGMSDDDPHNVDLITEEFRLLKSENPEMSFFIIYSRPDGYVKTEILNDGHIDYRYSTKDENQNQLSLL